MWDFDVHNVVRARAKIKLEFAYTSVKEELSYTLKETMILGTLFMAEGPREWSPATQQPEGFHALGQVDKDTRLSITIDETMTADNMRLWKKGIVGFLVPSSEFWGHYKKRFGL